MIRELLCSITGYRYHYRVRLEYRGNNQRVLTSVTMTMFTTSPRFVNQHREAKKALAPDLIAATPKNNLCNGTVVFEPIFFIGLFRPKKETSHDNQ